MIVSAIEGRIRMIEPVLKNRVKADALEKGVQQIRGVTGARVNSVIGSLLIHYDSSVAGSKQICRQIRRQITGSHGRSIPERLSGPAVRRYVKYGLLASILSNILFLMLSSEKWHVAAGTAFLSILSMHLFQNRRRLLK